LWYFSRRSPGPVRLLVEEASSRHMDSSRDGGLFRTRQT
jgi:hypothetical protein